MDYFDTCSTCGTQLYEGDSVILTADGTLSEPASHEDRRTAMYETDDWAQWRGVYCPSCWDRVLGFTVKLQNELHPSVRKAQR